MENSDIGGPAMIRAAAKNHAHVAVCTDADDVELILEEMDANEGKISGALKQRLASKTFSQSAAYDAAIANYFFDQLGETNPVCRVQAGKLKQSLRYGENPHQIAGFYSDGSGRPGIASATQIQGKELSYNNINDTDAAYELVAEFGSVFKGALPAVAIIKHANPCGVAVAQTFLKAYKNALACDPVAAFGGVLISNTKIDLATANEIHQLFCEVVIAPSYDQDALTILKGKKNRVILIQKSFELPKQIVRTSLNGLLIQDKDDKTDALEDLSYATNNKPTDKELEDLLFASKICKHTKSNTIVLVKNKQLLASGTGQTSRVDALRQAIEKAINFNFNLEGAAMASDAFFPFPDCVEIADKAGITNVIQPGGSIKDQLTIDYCNKNNVSMVMTGTRHFKH